ncbi:MAG: hypothetical protein JW793_10885 [Acidobacteria bacterium]|nr:hypothetical protein [Acidobacteriota bacterium]
MFQFFCFLLFFGPVPAMLPDEIAESGPESVAPLPPGAPRELAEAWLRLHEEELCLGIDAVFVPVESGYEVWGLVADEKHHKKLLRILQPLSAAGKVEILAAERVPRKEYEDGVPPSLWENDELRNFYRFPGGIFDTKITIGSLGMVAQEDIFVQRLIIFAEQTLEKSENMRRYAKDLPGLTHMARDRTMDPDLRLLASEICRNHVRDMKKQIDRLRKSLEQALPKGKEKREAPPQDFYAAHEGAVAEDLAAEISEEARNIAGEVHSFIYPESHTVELKELRSPVILNSLGILRAMGELYLKKMNRDSLNF